MGGVLEDVKHGHGCGAKAVDEECFEFALDKVGDNCHESGLLHLCHVPGAAVDVGCEGIEEWVDEDGPKVFDDEDGTPGDLWT